MPSVTSGTLQVTFWNLRPLSTQHDQNSKGDHSEPKILTMQHPSRPEIIFRQLFLPDKHNPFACGSLFRNSAQATPVVR